MAQVMGHQDGRVDLVQRQLCAEFIWLQDADITGWWEPVFTGETGPVIDDACIPAHFDRQAGDGQGIVTCAANQDGRWRHDGDQQHFNPALPAIQAVEPVASRHIMPG